MPHAVIEYSSDLNSNIEIASLMQAIHKQLLESGQFGEKDIKVRAYPCDHALVAGQKANFIHITIYMLSGRTAAIKKEITKGVLDVLHGLRVSAASLSVDARDLDRDVYSKTAN